MALTFQKGENEKIYITKLTRNSDKAVRTLSVNDVEYYNDYFDYTLLDDGTYSVKAKSTSIAGDIVIPSTYNGKAVTDIGERAFEGCGINRVVIPDGVTTIFYRAFSNCSRLIGITIPDSVYYVSSQVFDKCENLSSIVLSNSLTSIGDGMFRDCYAIERVVIPESVTTIGDSAFENCISLTRVYYKGTKTEWEKITIGLSNDYLKVADIYYYSETKPTTEGNYWHYVDGDIIEWGSACENGHTWEKTSCTTPLTCSVCGATKGETFEHTWSDWKLTKRQNCTEAGEKTRTCSACGKQEIEACGTALGHDCDDNGVVISQPTCTEQGHVMYNCLRCGEPHYEYPEALGHDWSEWETRVEATENTQGIEERICSRCKRVETKYTDALSGLTYIPLEDDTYAVAAADGYISGTVIIPSENLGKPVTQVAEQGFYGCTNIDEIILPESITTIGAEAFALSSIKNINIPANVTSIGNECFRESSIETVTFGENSKLGGIPYRCFRLCTYLRGVEIPDSVTYIGEQAFANCPTVSSITFGENSKLESIGEGAFENCYEIVDFAIPEGCLYIYDRAFIRCYNLGKNEKIYIPESVIKIGNSVFVGCHDNLSIEVAEGNIYYKVEGGCLIDNATGIIIFGNNNSKISSTASTIGSGAFYGNTYFAPIKIPLSVTTIESLAFGGENVTVLCEAPSKPPDWAADWCDDSVTVVWGYTDEGDSCSHYYGGWLTTVFPTCTRVGSMKRTCSICGEDEIVLIDPLGHNYEITKNVAQNCVKDGYITYTCSRCGNTYTEVIKADGVHSHSVTVVAPTCMEQGYTEYICDECGDTYKDNYTDALGHSWGDWEVPHPAECEAAGMRERKCIRCGEIETEIIEATGHDWDVEVEVVEPTCTDGGYTIHKCNNCSETKTDSYTDPLGHNIVNGVCTRCGYSEKGIVYYGVSAIPERYNSSFILGLEHQVASDSHLESISATPLADEYIYYCAPTSFGDCAFAYNNFVGGFTLIIEGLALTNAGGKTESYNIYKSNQANLGVNGAITITIKETG